MPVHTGDEGCRTETRKVIVRGCEGAGLVFVGGVPVDDVLYGGGDVLCVDEGPHLVLKQR